MSVNIARASIQSLALTCIAYPVDQLLEQSSTNSVLIDGSGLLEESKSITGRLVARASVTDINAV
jgi:hypothetical protein